MVNVAFVPPANVKLAGAVLKSAPTAATVTLMVVLAPRESMITIVAEPVATPVMVKFAALVLDGTATAVLLLAM